MYISSWYFEMLAECFSTSAFWTVDIWISVPDKYKLWARARLRWPHTCRVERPAREGLIHPLASDQGLVDCLPLVLKVVTRTTTRRYHLVEYHRHFVDRIQLQKPLRLRHQGAVDCLTRSRISGKVRTLHLVVHFLGVEAENGSLGIWAEAHVEHGQLFRVNDRPGILN